MRIRRLKKRSKSLSKVLTGPSLLTVIDLLNKTRMVLKHPAQLCLLIYVSFFVSLTD